MVNDDELAVFQRRAEAGMLRTADAQRVFRGLLAERQAREDTEQEVRALRARHQDDTAIMEVQRAE
jgi:hypothetical protein